MKLANFTLLLSIISLFSCHTTKQSVSVVPPPPPPEIAATPPAPVIKDTIQPIVTMNKTDTLLEELLKGRPEYFNDVLKNRDSLKVQIIYTQINRQENNAPVFKQYYFNVNADNYFYPASTVKMPVAALALQRLNELKVFGLDPSSTMITENNYVGQTPVYNDPTTPDGRPSISQYIKKIFLVSDNDAFNRLYEFLGQQYINEQLHKQGYQAAEILHRLSVTLSEDQNRHTNPVNFFSPGGKSLYGQPMQVNTQTYSLRKDSVGKGYYEGDQLINRSLNFSAKNRISLEDLTQILKSIMFPASVPEHQRFNLKPDEYRFVWKYMSQFPPETVSPYYDSTSTWDAYAKFLLYGSEKATLPRRIRIFNKVGDAYGFLTDVAYIADFDKKIEFMLSATIYCNHDGVLNDDKYDYETVGLPFMKNLGQVIYDYELKRDRLHVPDLSSFKLEYDR